MIINIQIIILLNLISAGTSTLNDDDVPEDLQSNSNYSWINRAKSWMVRKKFCMEFYLFFLLIFFLHHSIIYQRIKYIIPEKNKIVLFVVSIVE